MSIKQTILPRIALYKVLGGYTTDEERVKFLRHYMIDIVASKNMLLRLGWRSFRGSSLLFRVKNSKIFTFDGLCDKISKD